VLWEVLSLSFSFSFCLGFEHFLAILYHFAWFVAFHIFVGLAVFFLLDDIIKSFLAFWSSNCASWGFGFKLQTSNFVLFIVNGPIKGEIEKPSDQLLGLIVMSHWLAEV
jgi:hypothetical protein